MALKTLLIALLVGVISIVHLLYTGTHVGFHVLHQQLFYIPLVLASLWFGTRASLSTAVAVSVIYGPTMLFQHKEGAMQLVVITQIALYLLVAFLIGWLSDRQRRQQHLLLRNERITSLGKAASTLGLEIRDIVSGIETVFEQSEGLKNEDINDDFLKEINRLKKVVDGLKHFSQSLDHAPASSDLNDILTNSAGKYQEETLNKNLKIVLYPHDTGCPSTAPTASISRIFDGLVSNAVDFSKEGQTIILRSFSKDNEWGLEVADSGTGVVKENEEKLFSPFFTTRPDGFGLSLSSGRKLLRDLGGDLVFEPGKNGGAIFRILIPHQPQKLRDEAHSE